MSERPAGWLSDRELGEVDPADKAAFRSPVPTQVVSNGEYNPMPQTEKQRQVEGLIKEYADKYSKYHGVDRRKFLQSASGFAAAFLAMNKVFGPVFEVSEADRIVIPDPDTLLTVNELLEKLASDDPGSAAIARLRLFAGLSIEEAAAALSVSRATAFRDWAYARAILTTALSGEEKPEHP